MNAVPPPPPTENSKFENSNGLTRRSFLKGAAASAAAPLFAHGLASMASAQSDPTLLTIAEAGRLIASRRLSPVELMDATLARIDRLQPIVGAFITVVPEAAREDALAAEREIMRGAYRGPLHGIPFGVKDTHYTQGVLTTASSPVLGDFYPEWDATVVARLKAAGSILVGKLNLPEWSFGGETPGTHNPWNLSRSPAGSSGGSGAAVASRQLAASTGGDTSGSIRGPSTANGVVGMMPTYGRVSRYGVVAISWSLDHVGPMTRTVEDNALMLRVMAGYDPNDLSTAKVPVPDYTRALTRTVRGLRIAIPNDSLIGRSNPEALAAFREAIGVIEGLGANVREIDMPPTFRFGDDAQRIIRISEAAAYHRPFLIADPAKYEPSPRVRRDVEAASLLTAPQYLRALQVRALWVRESRELMADLDALIIPGSTSPASFQTPFSLNGLPWLNVPIGFSETTGLPLGMGIVGAAFAEEVLYTIGQAYQQATDWHTRVPAL